MGTLRPVAMTNSEDLATSVNKLNVVKAATDYVLGRGMTFASLTSEFRGQMPPDLAHLDDTALGQLLSYMSEYCGFIESELSIATANRNVAEDILERTMADVRKDLRAVDGKLTVQDKNDIMISDERVVNAKSTFLYWDTIHILTKPILDRCQRNWDTISRQITQRGQQVDRMVRGNAMQSMPTINPRFGRSR